MSNNAVATTIITPDYSSVKKWQNPEITQRLMRELGLSAKEARLLFEDVKKFLYLCAISRNKLTPPHPIDMGWHEFLMYTRDYASFCKKVLGVYIHHVPDPVLKPVEQKPTAQDTIAFAKEVFGPNLSHNWIKRNKTSECSADDDSNCHGCSNCAPDSDCHGDGTCGGDV